MARTTTPKPIGRRAVRRAIAIIEDSKQSHVQAIEEPKGQILGDKAFHKRCVKEYEQVLRVLRKVRDG